MDEIEHCNACGRELITEAGDAFLTDDGLIWCNDDFPGRDLAG